MTDSTIAVTVTATDKESGLASSNVYKYYLNSESSPRATSSSNTYTFTGLTEGTDYTIKVEVVDKGNNTGTGTAQITTVVQYITFTVQPMIPIGTSKQFQVPSGSTWEEFINSYGGSDAGFYADAGYVSYLASQEFSRVCMVFEQSTERIVRTSDVIMANYTYSYAPM